MDRPDMVARYDMILALRAAARVKAGEPLPSPEEVAATDPDWEDSVFRFAMHLLNFYIDYDKRPTYMQ
jgi:hypothetical protein